MLAHRASYDKKTLARQVIPLAPGYRTALSSRPEQIQRATMVYKSLHGLAPDYLCSKFKRRETACNLRDSENNLNVLLPCTNYYIRIALAIVVPPFGTVFLVI